MEKKRITGMTSLQLALESVAKKLEKTISVEKSRDFAQTVEISINSYDPTVGKKYKAKLRGLSLKIRNVDLKVFERILDKSLTSGQFLNVGS